MKRLRAGPTMGLALAMALAVAGCGILEPGASRAGLDLARAQALWVSADLDDYDLRVERRCYCPAEGVVRVQVRSGVRVATVTEPGDDGLPAQPAATEHPTVEELFALVAEAIDAEAAEIRVTYHAVLGYPVELWIDRSVNVADEEVGYTAELVAPGADGG